MSASVWSDPWSDRHQAYLERMGFREAERDGATVMQLAMGEPPRRSKP